MPVSGVDPQLPEAWNVLNKMTENAPKGKDCSTCAHGLRASLGFPEAKQARGESLQSKQFPL